MPDRPTQRLSIHEAAKILYDTEVPTAAQIRQVQRRLERGLLKGWQDGQRSGGWMTTAAWVAEYMATQAYQQQLAREQGSFASGAQPGGNRRAGEAQLLSVYHEALREYFQALIFRRRARNASRRFQQAVLAGQVLLLLLLLGAMSLVFSSLDVFEPPERTAVRQWLDRNAAEYVVEEWCPATPGPQGTGTLVRVRYRYVSGLGKAVHTERTFLVRGDLARPFDVEDDE